MKSRWLLILAMLAAGNASACINYIGTDKYGNPVHPHHVTGRELARMLSLDAKARGMTKFIADQGVPNSKDERFRRFNNQGVVLIFQAKPIAAIHHFLDQEKKFPGRAETAANLGTALELAGMDKSALKWIRIGMQRNPNEHAGTEWLHARILGAKIADAQRNWDRQDSIAGIAFQGEIPEVPEKLPLGNRGNPVTPYQLNEAFHYQIWERTALVRPRDWVLANLIEDWATLNLSGGAVENANALYPLALRYGAPYSRIFSQRMEAAARLVRLPKGKGEGICPICYPPPPRPPN